MTSNKLLLRAMAAPMLLVLLATTALWAQTLYQGPAAGSIPGGAPVNTGGLAASTEAPGRLWLPPATRKVELLPDELNRVAPSAALRSNEFYDTNLVSPLAGDAPLKLSGFQGIPDLGVSIPPDPHIAAGPNHLVAVVNSRIGIFDKQGNVLRLINADDWYSNVLNNAGPFDPQVVYDPHSERWIMVWIHLDENPPRARLLLSVSDDADPLGAWCNWSLPDNTFGANDVGFFGDFPKLGFDADAIYVTSNMFNIATPRSFQSTRVRVIPKQHLLDNACGPVTWNDLWDLRDPNNLSTRVFTVTPTIVFGNAGPHYLVSDAPYTTGTFVTLWELFDPLGTPFISGTNIPVTASRNPPNADQLGGSTTLIDGGINRSFRHAPVYRDGHVWGVQGVAGGTNGAFAFVRYLRLNVASYRAVEDAAFGANNFWYIYPAAMPDANGNLFISFTRTGLTEYPSARFSGRLASDSPGLQASTLLKAGEANYVKTFGATRNRWGDYLGIALDPAEESKVWIFGQYAASEIGTGANADRWGTWIGAATFTPLTGRHLRSEPDSMRFATLELGQKSSAFPVTLSNVGTETVTVASVSLGTSAFVLSNLPALPKTLASFNDLTFAIAFEPSQAGTLRDTITVRDNGNQKLFAIPLSGRALGTVALRGTVRDSFTNSPIKARLQFFRDNETTPRAVANTATDGSYSVLILEGEYTIDVMPEIPYAPFRRSVTHTFPGTTSNLALAPAALVLVNDDSVASNLEVYKTQLSQLGYEYALWNLREEGQTVPANRLRLLAEPAIMVWFTGETKADVLTQADRNVIIEHLQQGNPVLLSGDNVAESSLANDSLLTHYLGVKFDGNFGQPLVRGFTGDPIGNGLLTGTSGTSKDILQLLPNAPHPQARIFRYLASSTDTVTTRIAGVRVENTTQGWRTAYFGFRLESTSATNRRTIFERTLNWLKDTGVDVTEPSVSQLPQDFYLSQNHPNPFNPSTLITFHLPQAALATLQVYDLSGRVIATLVNERRAAGEHRVKFEARDLAAGVYFYRLQAGENLATRKLVLLR